MQTETNILNDLQTASCFSHLPQDALEVLVPHFEVLEVVNEEYLFHEGDPTEIFYIVRRGEFAAFRDAVGTPVQLLDRLRRGDFFGHLGLFTDGRHPAAVRATEDSVVLQIKRADLLAFLDEYPELRGELEDLATQRYSALVAAGIEAEKGREVRVRVKNHVDLELEDGTVLPVELDNLSVGGFSLSNAPESWKADEVVHFGLRLPAGTLRLAGRIAWRRGDHVGLAFTEMSAKHDTMIQMAIHLLIDSQGNS